ncbi:outer membrane protein assembly factor BamB family protein [Zavarzinella formosa]|uniref:outer membrane protein assembly factor BamB family protein n=1 Tax=Zavarzinella formosa TaxID=360055 RepID=UPI0002ED3D5D|nr:PQQ-binding-like beta-propeller repeat protein [Zavarzinella formosa]
MMTPLRRSRVLLGLTLFGATMALTISAQGQPVGIAVAPLPPGAKIDDKKSKKDDRDWNESITLPVEREAHNKIEAVQKYLTGKETITPKLWGDIISVLQGMLDDPTDKFVEVNDGAGKPSKVSVKIEVNRIIGTFNDDGRKDYQRIVGPDADDKLKRAIEEGDMGLMAELSQRYLHSKAGAEATIRLGTWHLDRGRYQQAARTFKDLLQRNHKDELPAPLLFKAALAYKRQGKDPEFAKAAEKYWDMFEKVSNKDKVMFGTAANPVPVPYEKLKTEYEKVVVSGPPMFTGEWGVFRGDPTNNGVGKGGTPFLEPRFTYSIINPIDDLNYETKKSGFEVIKDRMDKALKQMDNKGQAAIPGSFPLAATGKIVFRGYDGVYCLATKDNDKLDPPMKAGELLWKSETDMGLLQMVRDLGPRTMTDQFLNFYMNSGPHSIIFENSLLGTMSHDGTNLYFIDDMAVPPHPQQFMQNVNFDGRTVTFGVFQDPVFFSKLKAVNMETGKVVWKIGERTPNAGNTPAAGNAPLKETTETLLADCLFLGPPLPLGGKLYVVVEKDGDLRLVCLDPTKLEPSSRQPTPVPSLVWSQALGQPNGRLPNDSLRRHQGVHLAYADGMLVVPTNAGAVLGVDLFSHSLVWAANYKSNKTLQQQPQEFEGKGFRRPQPFPGGMGGNASFDTGRERWHASAPIIANGKVIITAFDSDTVECVDLQDGRSVWKSPISRLDTDLYVAGVFGDKVMIAGKGYVRFHSLATGVQLKEPLVTGIPTGIGAATKDTNLYYIPVKASKDKSTEPGIVAVDTKNMLVKGTSRSRKKESAGNLLFYDNDVYSLNANNLASFPQLDLKIRETQERLAKNAADPVGLLDLAMLEHDDGRLTSAIENYRKCLASKPAEETRAKGREKLFEAITELLQSDFNSGEKMLDEYKKLCEVEIPEAATEAQRKILAEEELRRKSNFFCLVAKGKENQGKLLDAFENYMSFGTLVGNKEMVTVIDEPNTNARPDVWARGRIQNMIKKATPEQRKPLEDKVVEEWNKVRDTNDVEKLRGFVKVFGGMFDAGTEARITLADKLAATSNEEDTREAEYMLFALRTGEDTASAAKATEALARLYIRKGLLDDAVGMINELGQRFPKEVIKDGKTGAEFLTDLQTDKRFLPYLEPPTVTWTHNKLKGTEIASVGGYDARANTISVTLPPDALPFYTRNRLVIDMQNRSGQGWGLKLTDRVTGTDVFTSPGIGYPQWQYLFQQNNIPYKMVQIKGHIAVISMHGNHPQTGQQMAKVHAFDLADKKKLWEVDLFGTNPNPIVLQQGAVNQQVEADGIRVTYQDGWSMKVGQQWVVEAAYSVVLTRDGLVAKDNARGTVLWTKSGVSSRTHLLGDSEHVFTYEANPDGAVSMVRCYRAADGVEVQIPDSSQAFTNIKRTKVYGRRVLTGDETAGKKCVRLYDLLTGKDIWKRDIPGDGWMIHTQMEGHTGYVTAAGDVVVMSTTDGKDIFKAKLDESLKAQHLEKVNEVMLFGDESRFFVMLNKPTENGRFFNPVFTQSITSAKVNGTMYAFSRATSKKLWHTEEQLEDQNIVLEQFGELPIIMAANQFQKINANGNFEGQFMKFVAIDKETGKLRFAKQGLAQGQYYAILTDAKAGTIEVLNHSNQRIRFSPDDGKDMSSATPKTSMYSTEDRTVPGVPVPAIRIQRLNAAPVRINVAPVIEVPVAPAPPKVVKD